MQRPEVIFLDAVGTIFGVRGHVGEIYASIAEKFGVSVAPDALNQAFLHSFRSAPPLAFPGINPLEVPRREYEWWQAVSFYTFQQTQSLDQFTDFPSFFAELYRHFSTGDPWFVYPDVLPALKRWHQEGITLGIISNFDSRIYKVLDALGLAGYFASITISTEVGSAKPNPKIFYSALQKHNCPPELAWHVGDTHREDYEGAKAVGMRGVLIQRTVG